MTDKTAAEYTADALGEMLLMALPKPVDTVAAAALGVLRANIGAWLHQDWIRHDLLVAARRAETEFRARARLQFEDDRLEQAVASFPLFDRELFQTTLQTLPSHLNEDYVADQLTRYIADDWKGAFAATELRAGVALYMNCLRVQLLAVEGYGELVSRLATMRTDERTERILALSQRLTDMVEGLQDRIEITGTIATTSFTIPEPVGDFVGRAAQLQQLKDDLTDGAGIVAISGIGGVGKTELARMLAKEVRDRYPDGRLGVELLGTSQEAMTWQEAMRQLLQPYFPREGLPENDQQLQGVFLATFASKNVLMLLDDAAGPEQVRRLIPPKPSAAIITSRQHFSLAEAGVERPVRLDVLAAEESSALLLSTSRRFAEASPAQLREVADLCGRLPLALRVAGSLLNDREDWNVAALVGRLRDETTRLSRLSREGDRQLNVEAAMALSYDLLSEERKQRFRTLGIFSGWIWPLPAAAVWNLSSVDEANETLDALVSRSLLTPKLVLGVSVTEQKTAAMHIFIAHDLTRMFAAQLLRQVPEEAADAVERHARVFMDLAAYCDDLYERGAEQRQQALGQFAGILPELVSALGRLGGQDASWPRPAKADELLEGFAVKIQSLLQVAVTPGFAIQFYEGQLEVIRRKKKGIPEEDGNLPPPDEAWVPVEAVILINLADAYSNANKPRVALEHLKRALAVIDGWQRISPRGAMVAKGKLLGNMGSALFQLGDHEEALQKFRESLSLARSAGDGLAESTALGNIGNVYAEQGEHALAIDYYEDELALAGKIGFKRDLADGLGNMATVFSRLGENLAAAHLRERAIEIARELGDLRREGKFLSDIAVSYVELGDGGVAVQAAEAAAALLRHAEYRTAEGECLVNLGSSYAQVGRSEQAVGAWTRAIEVFREVAYPGLERAEPRLRQSIKQVKDEPGEERTPRTMVARVIGAYRRGSSEVASMFSDMRDMSRDPTLPPEVRETSRILHRILAGVRNPDLSTLPYSLAQAVVYHLNKPIISEAGAVG